MVAEDCVHLIQLSCKIRDANALGQDYHPLNLDVGECARFYGNKCTHFTLANDTPDTRVSLGVRACVRARVRVGACVCVAS